jgi:phosphopantothenoylcysteine decarboxylase/phosphopantothenate--cysteine ligase
MRCIVTAGPTYEPLDKVRRLTNFSTGQLGSELAAFLTEQGYEVTLLLGQLSTYHGILHAQWVQTFSTTQDLREHLRTLGGDVVDAVFHAAAVSDFTFGKIWNRSEQGQLTEITAGKLSTRAGTLLAELLPTPKIISQLREFFPKALLVGWKYEVDGDRANLMRVAQEQMATCQTDACIANGPAYGHGFGFVQLNGCTHHETTSSLFAALGNLVRQPARIATKARV